ncbi:hypothetical protein [Brachybacterium sp. J153]|uniref:hypothetical protein n=1 Tax=Brachybacterium sp. J153 TaxID=3116488 RepID=UPI002E78AF1D|nr:hypothetical protein [Brachybacterium sp. J153]MEE1618901.1 hypothetical protein [Brachybacterium sp. J153]
MDEDGTTADGPGDAADGGVDAQPPRSLRGRATASVAALGAATLLVLSFGPAALALSPTASAAGSSGVADAVWTTPLTGQTPILALPPRSAEEDGSDG